MSVSQRIAGVAIALALTTGLGAPLVTGSTVSAVKPDAKNAQADKKSGSKASTNKATKKTKSKVGACKRLSTKKRKALRKALTGKKLASGKILTNHRCFNYTKIVQNAKKRAKQEAAKKQTAKAKAPSHKPTQTPSPTPKPKVDTTPSPTPSLSPSPSPSPTSSPSPSEPESSEPLTVFGLSANGEHLLKEAEQKLGITAGVVGVFADFTHQFPAADAQHAKNRGASLLISWEPWNWEVKSQHQPEYALDRITAGDYDDYIRQFAQDAAATNVPVFIRFAAEMNGDWHVWSNGFNGNETGDYKAAYRHVVDTARAAGGTNIKWMFNPIISYEGSTPLAELYPGHDYVDWVALDGYNWGELKWGWQSFDDIFTMGLQEIKSVAPDKPLGIAEIGSTPGPDKAAWVTDVFEKARANGVRMLVWFEHNKETDWRLSTEEEVAQATKTAVSQPGWLTGGDLDAVHDALRD